MSLHISPDLGLPLDAVTETFAILAKRGAGKSNAGVVMAEEMYDNSLPWVAIDPKGDWWGVRAAGDGKAPGLSVLVFGGLHGDVPLEPSSGRLVADLIVEQRLTCVLDVSEMTKADQRRFLVDFADRLYRRNTEPLHVFCEEADEYIPQRVMGENAKLVGAFETLVKRGRTRGLGVTLITQRSASLNKDVLTQIETLIPMRTPSPQDRKAILAWVEVHDAGREAVDALPGLASGEAFVFSPQWLNTLVRIRFRRRRTFDSGATPTVGGKPRPPAQLADVDLAAIKEAMAETIEKAKADDPRELRKQIADLTKGVDRAYKDGYDTGKMHGRIEVPVLTDDDRAFLEAMFDAIESSTKPIVQAFTSITDEFFSRVERINSSIESSKLPVAAKQGLPSQRGSSAASPSIRPDNGARLAPSGTAASQEIPAGARETRPAAPAGHLSGSQRKILDALAWFASVGIHAPTRGQVAFQARVSPKSSGFEKNCSTLRTSGLLEYPGPNRVSLTDAGGEHANWPSRPGTSADLQQAFYDGVSRPQALILSYLVDLYPNEIDRESLAQALDVSSASSGFEKNLSTLRSLGLIDYPAPGYVVATDLLFIN